MAMDDYDFGENLSLTNATKDGDGDGMILMIMVVIFDY